MTAELPGDERASAGDLGGLDRASATLRTARLVLEPLRVEHAEAMSPLLDDARLHRFTGGNPATLGELRLQYARQTVGRSPDGHQRWLNWIARQRSDGSAVGLMQATVTGGEESTAELAWTIAVAFQRRGYAREAARGTLEWLGAHGVRRFVAHIHPEHAASSGVARALGLVPTDEMIDGEICWVSVGPATSWPARSTGWCRKRGR